MKRFNLFLALSMLCFSAVFAAELPSFLSINIFSSLVVFLLLFSGALTVFRISFDEVSTSLIVASLSLAGIGASLELTSNFIGGLLSEYLLWVLLIVIGISFIIFLAFLEKGARIAATIFIAIISFLLAYSMGWIPGLPIEGGLPEFSPPPSTIVIIFVIIAIVFLAIFIYFMTKMRKGIRVISRGLPSARTRHTRTDNQQNAEQQSQNLEDGNNQTPDSQTTSGSTVSQDSTSTIIDTTETPIDADPINIIDDSLKPIEHINSLLSDVVRRKLK